MDCSSLSNQSTASTTSRPTSRIEDVPELQETSGNGAQVQIEVKKGEETDDDEDFLDPKSRYFSWVNVFCIILSLLISAYFIFEPQLISAFWKIITPEETPEYVLNLKSCKIPTLYDGQSELPFMWDLDVRTTNDLSDLDLNCAQVERFSSVLEDNNLILLSKLKKRSCCVRDITRPGVMIADMYSVSSTCAEVKNMTDISGKEFILVQCSHSRNKSVDFNTHALIPMKPPVQEKLNYWNSIFDRHGKPMKSDEKPFSVAVIVLGSTSKAHAYRSLPETMGFLEGKFGFSVMNGYNIMEDWRTSLSFANMIQLISGGLGPDEGDWITYWDNDTKLLSDFRDEKYVSMFIDGSRKLLRSSHGDPYGLKRYRSFLQQPTDYYVKPLLEAHKEATEALFTNRGTSKHHCFGKRTSTSYLLRHLAKFHRKFSSVPTFSFSFFSWPQDDYGLEALSKMDKTYLDFFKDFIKTPQILERTAIVVMSDIGSLNHAYFKTEHGNLEKLNPLLMIRLPDNLVSKHPMYKDNLKVNSHRLISPIDVHKTISIFSKIGIPKQKASSILIKNEDETGNKILGRNIFTSEIPLDRNCSQAYIPEKLCLCGRSIPTNFNGRTITTKEGRPEKYWHYQILPS